MSVGQEFMAKSKQGRKRQPARPTAGWFSTLSPGMQDLVCIGLLYVVILVLFRGLVFEDNAFSSSGDTANHHSYKKAGNTLMEKEGEDALWTPYVFSGLPTFGNVSYLPHNVSYLETAAITVVKALFLFSPMSWFVAFYFLGGVFMFFLLRTWDFPRPAALIAALTFMLSPYAIALGSAGHGSKLKALSYLPLMILLTHQLFERRNLLSFGLLAAGVGTLMLTNHVQIVYYVLLVMGLYLIYTVIGNLRTEQRIALIRTALFAGAVVVGLCISAYVYLSVLEYSQYSIRGGGTAGSSGGLTWDYATNWSMHPLELITVIIPSFFGFQSPYYWGWMPFTTSTVYVGIIPVILSVIGVLYNRRGLALFFLILTGVILLMSFGKHFAPAYNLLFEVLPFFNKFRAPSTILHLLPFALGVLAAVGFSSLTSVAEDAGRTAKARQRLMVTLGTLSVLVVLILLFKDALFQFSSASMLVKEGELQQYQQQYGGRAGQVIDQLKEIRFNGNEVIGGLWNDTLRFLLFAIAGVGATLLFLSQKMRQGQFAAALMVILVVDLFLIDARFINPVPARALDENFRPDPAITFLKEQPGLFRIFPLGNQFGDNTYAYHGLQSLGGYNAAKLKIYQTLLDSCMYVPTSAGVPVNMNVVNMLNARYFLTSYPLPQERFPVEYKDDSRKVTIYRNPEALPRTFFVPDVRLAADDNEVFRILNSPTFDPAQTAVIQGDVALPDRPADSTRVQLTGYRSRRITMSAFASSPAILVLSEVYYPAGWKASIDGEETPILRTNSILRSVLVPGGEHEIIFTFDPPTYATGKSITYAAWSLVVICILAGLGRDPVVRSRLFRMGISGRRDREQRA